MGSPSVGSESEPVGMFLYRFSCEEDIFFLLVNGGYGIILIYENVFDIERIYKNAV